MKPTISIFKSPPDKGRGLARDMRIRWALEEIGQAYDVMPLTFPELKQPEYLALHPFGQIPMYQEGELALFESGAILFYLAEKHAQLLPKDANGRALALSWMFAAVSTVDAPVMERSMLYLLDSKKPWYQERLTSLDQTVTTRLQQLSTTLGTSEWLVGDFSVADILMIHVLRRLERTDLMKPFENILAYIARGEARPAYKRAFEAQLKAYNDSVKASD